MRCSVVKTNVNVLIFCLWSWFIAQRSFTLMSRYDVYFWPSFAVHLQWRILKCLHRALLFTLFPIVSFSPSLFIPPPIFTTPIYVFLSVPSLLSCTAMRSSEIQLREQKHFGKPGAQNRLRNFDSHTSLCEKDLLFSCTLHLFNNKGGHAPCAPRLNPIVI